VFLVKSGFVRQLLSQQPDFNLLWVLLLVQNLSVNSRLLGIGA
jgi:hypothetical protein